MINIKLHIRYHIYIIWHISLHSRYCGYWIASKGFSGPRWTFRPQWRCIYIVYGFLGYASVFSFTLEKCRTADQPWVDGPALSMHPEEQMRGQPGARGVSGCEAAATSLVAAVASGSPSLTPRSEWRKRFPKVSSETACPLSRRQPQPLPTQLQAWLSALHLPIPSSLCWLSLGLGLCSSAATPPLWYWLPHGIRDWIFPLWIAIFDTVPNLSKIWILNIIWK